MCLPALFRWRSSPLPLPTGVSGRNRRARHPSPVLFHNGEFSYLKTKPDFVLGEFDNCPYNEHTITLSKGDRIFVYSDGVTEATNSEQQLFEEERLLEAIKKTEKLNAPDTLKSIRSSIDEFVGEAEQFDDITMLQFINVYGRKK